MKKKLFIVGLTLLLGLTGCKKDIKDVDIVAEVTKHIDANPFYQIIYDVQETNGTEVDNRQYWVAHDKALKETSYLYRTSDSDLYQYWTESDGTMDMYIYAEEFDTWVQYTMESGDMYMRPEIIPALLESAELLDGTYVWESEEGNYECYCYSVISANEEYENIIRMIYVRTKDYMPMGIHTVCVNELDETVTDSTEYTDENVGDVQEDITVNATSDFVTRYSLIMSKDTCYNFLSKPEEFIDSETYLQMLSQKEDINE